MAVKRFLIGRLVRCARFRHNVPHNCTSTAVCAKAIVRILLLGPMEYLGIKRLQCGSNELEAATNAAQLLNDPDESGNNKDDDPPDR